MNHFFTKKIQAGECDEAVHKQFQKFSRGVFKNKALVKITSSQGLFKIGTTNEYANEFVKFFGHKLGQEKAHVTGAIITTIDLRDSLKNMLGKVPEIKQFMGIKQYQINGELSGNDLVKICTDFADSFIALSFKVKNSELKIKAKAPKSAKPSTDPTKKPKTDFCVVKTDWEEIAHELVFEKKDFKKAEVEHDYSIEEIILPKNVQDPNEMRRLAKRKGKLVRRTVIDEKSINSEHEFVA